MADACVATADLSTLDRGVLEALIAAQQQEMSAKDAVLAAQQEKLLSRDNEIEHLKLVIAKLRRMIFGTKSEKVTREIEQLELKLEELETGQAERVTAATTASTPEKSKPKRRPLPEHLPREVHTHQPAEDACPDCGGQLRKLGEDASEILERVPASYKVIRHVRLKMACTKCDVIVEAACWAHARRKLYDIQVANGSAIAAEAVQRIGALYDIEREVHVGIDGLLDRNSRLLPTGGLGTVLRCGGRIHLRWGCGRSRRNRNGGGGRRLRLSRRGAKR